MLGYKPISDYGVIGDMQSAALVGADGSIDWACLPYFDSPAVFLRLLDEQRGGYCAVHVENLVSSSRHYLDATNILETTFTTKSGSLVLTDFMPVRKQGQGEGRGGNVTSDHRIVRLVRCTTVPWTSLSMSNLRLVSLRRPRGCIHPRREYCYSPGGRLACTCKAWT